MGTGMCGAPERPAEDINDGAPAIGDFGVAHQAEGHAKVALRESADGGKVIGMIPNGDKIKIIDKQGDSSKVLWKEKRGWVKAINAKAVVADAPHPGKVCVICQRPTFGGYKHCCRTCQSTQGRSHGPRCEESSKAPAPSPEVAPTPTPQVGTCVACRRPPRGGHSHCCRTCENTKGQSHGTQCEQANAPREDRGAAAAARESTQRRAPGPRCEAASPTPVAAVVADKKKKGYRWTILGQVDYCPQPAWLPGDVTAKEMVTPEQEAALVENGKFQEACDEKYIEPAGS